jgi:hypothetical protein
MTQLWIPWMLQYAVYGLTAVLDAVDSAEKSTR